MKLGLVLELALLGEAQVQAALRQGQGQGQMLVALEQQLARRTGRGWQRQCLLEGGLGGGLEGGLRLPGLPPHSLRWC